MPYGSVVKDGFYAKVAELGGTVIDEWKGTRIPHHVICVNGHDCYPNPCNVNAGKGICTKCINSRSNRAEMVFRRILAERGAILLESKWRGTHESYRIQCPEGHDAYATPHSVARGGGICRTCSGQDSAIAEQNFRNRLTELGATLVDSYHGSLGNHAVICKNGHECHIAPHNITSHNQGICYKCNGTDWSVFYIVTNDHSNSVKFGISSGDGEYRLSRHSYDGYTKVIKLIIGLPDGMARTIENSCLATLRDNGFTPIHGREYFNADALPVILDIAEVLAK